MTRTNKPNEHISTTELGLLLGVHITAGFLRATFKHIEPALVTRNATYWRRADIADICLALSDYFKQQAQKHD